MPRGGHAHGAGTARPLTAALSDVPAAPVVTGIFVTSVAPPNLDAGQTYQLIVELRDASGAIVFGRTLAYQTSSGSIATVSGTGLVTAVAAGTATITVTGEGLSKTQSVLCTVPQTGPASITLNPTSLGQLDTQAPSVVTAVVRDASGNALTGQTVAWASNNTPVATVGADSGDPTHQTSVTPHAAGSATISATSGAVSNSLVDTVTASGGVQPLVFEDYSIYTDDADFKSAAHLWPSGNWDGTTDDHPGGVYGNFLLDPAVTYYPGGKSMRYDWFDRTNDPNRCTDYTIRRTFKFPVAVTEHWIEVPWKCTSNFDRNLPTSWNCTGHVAGWKFLLHGVNGAPTQSGGYSRWDCEMPANSGPAQTGWQMSTPQGNTATTGGGCGADLQRVANNKVGWARTFYYSVLGTPYNVAPDLTTGVAPTGATIPANTWGSWRVAASSLGVVSLVAAAANGTGYATQSAASSAVPAAPAGTAPMGYVVVLTASGQPFVPGTDALQGGTGGNPATTTAYTNCCVGFEFNGITNPHTWWDGNWHVFRMHCKVGTPTQSCAANGIYAQFIDGVQNFNRRAIQANCSSTYKLDFGANGTAGTVNMSCWWGGFKYYTSDPGWGF